MTSRRAPQRPTGGSVGRLLVLLVALAGLFAMHGLSDHGMAGPSEMMMDEGVLAAHAAHTPHAPHAAAPVASTGGQEAPHFAPAHPEPDHDMGLMGLCLAVVVGVIAVAIALLLLHVTRIRTWLPVLLPSLLGSVRARVPRPPNRFALSIQRC